MIITEKVFVKIVGKNIKHYRSLGYNNIKFYDIIEVPIEHLSIGSHIKIDVQCDFCNKLIKKVYKSLLNERNKSFTKKDCCSDCISTKGIKTNNDKYNCNNCMERSEVVDKLKKSIFLKYGVEYISQNKNIQNIKKIKFNSRTKESISVQNEKTRLTVQERYGVDCPLQLPYARKKLFETQSKASSQQIKLYNILKNIYGEKNVCINFSFSTLSLDIVVSIKDNYIDVEYDSWYWHNPLADRKRDEFVKSQGFSVLRIKSSRLLPNENELKLKIDFMIKNKYRYSEMILDDWNEKGYKEVYEKGGRK